MGHTIWVEVHGRPLEETASDSSIMHRLDRKLDALAAKLGVTKLTEFYDYSELEEAYGDLDEEPGERDDAGENEADEAADDQDDDGSDDETDSSYGTPEQRAAKGEWFDSAAALASVQAIRKHLLDHFDDLGFRPDDSTRHWPGDLMSELENAEEILTDAAARGRQFRLLIVP
jgi:hypothetical protein